MTPRGKYLSSFILLLALSLAVTLSHSFASSITNNKSDATIVEQQESVVATEDEAAVVEEDDSLRESSETKTGDMLLKWLHIHDKDNSLLLEDNTSILAYGPKVPGNLAEVFGAIGEQDKGLGFFSVMFRAILAIGLGGIAVFVVSRMARQRISQLLELTPPEKSGSAIIWAGLLRSIPALINLLVLAAVSTVIFLLMANNIGIGGRMVFQALLGIVLIVLFVKILSTILFAPDDEKNRFLPIAGHLIKPLHRAFVLSLSVLVSGLLITRLVKGLGATPQTFAWVQIVLGTSVIAVFAYIIVFLKEPVKDGFLADIKEKGGSWLKEQFTAHWHLFALLYLVVVWLVWLGQELSGTFTSNGSFVVSMLIVPSYFVLSFAGKSLIASLIDSLNLYTTEDDESGDIEYDNAENSHEKRALLITKTHFVFKLVLAATLLTWVFSLWGFQIPYATQMVKVLFKSLVVVALALVFWRFASSYIENKMEEATPEVAVEEGVDDEFGGAVARGRSHTLLPMVRKLLGSVLMLMVVLIIISSLGVDIGPLLAGAGVLGLAVGFGAQKLVSDILSGFFFLLDDAFRVGEYIQAGKIRGTVEAITLRNVMLRHHLGMLQVVPHSDLGSVTNYMRGGIVIKFPLEFSYDTDIDKVRKIIKRVGQAMLEDEEVGDDFILPLKSQGVYEISNSVMVIRVKFTAKPGKQFVIKREAFRRITEALNAKGIYYAHRKVIVDIPNDPQQTTIDGESDKRLLQAGASAALAAEMNAEKDTQS